MHRIEMVVDAREPLETDTRRELAVAADAMFCSDLPAALELGEQARCRRLVPSDAWPELEQCPEGRPEPAVVVEGDLAAAAAFLEARPGAGCIARACIRRRPVRYRMQSEPVESGFRCYVPDYHSLRDWELAGDNESLGDWLRRAAPLALTAVWLHCEEAERRGTGLALDALDYAAPRYSGALWISGGVSDPRHLEALARAGRAGAVVLPAALVRELGGEALRRSLRPALSLHAAPAVCGAAGMGAEGP